MFFNPSRRLLKIVAPLIFLISLPGQGEVLTDLKISEFLANNRGGLKDEDGDSPDWIELWNTSGVAGETDGWYLTDDPFNLTKWQIPAVEMPANGYLTIFASDKNRSAPSGELHTNFRLQTEAGGYLALVRPDGITIASEFSQIEEQIENISFGIVIEEEPLGVLLEEGDLARFFVPTEPLIEWQDPGFEDSAWSSGTTGIGFQSSSDGFSQFLGSAQSTLRSQMRGENASVFIRIPFNVTDSGAVFRLTLSTRWEDGFVAYLNGQEVHRERAPANLTWQSASDPPTGRPIAEALVLDDYLISASALVSGQNILAIHGLNNATNNSDFLFSPRLTATQLNLIDGVVGFFPDPTPGEANGDRFDGVVADTKFSVDRGLHQAPFTLAITTATQDAPIRYTTDGSPPTETGGLEYLGPIQIDKTTIIRAIATRPGYLTTNVDTQSYLFPADVVDQPAMRSAITQDPVFGPQMIDSLTSIPSIMINFDGSDIDRTEVPVSVELLNFEDGNLQVDAGAARFGSYFTNFAKRSFRLHFRSRYGPRRLEFPLFENIYEEIPPVKSFDSLDIRAGNHDMVLRGAYLANRFTDDATLEMGNIAPHGRFVHIYFNGSYRGQYHLRERWSAAMLSDYLPGKEEEYDTINANNNGWEFQTGTSQDGDLVEWNDMRNQLVGPTPYSSVKDKLDVANLIDFFLLWTTGTSEAEFRAGGSVENGVGFKFFLKDADGFLQPPSGNNLPPGGISRPNVNGPLNAMPEMRAEGDPDFLILLADRIHKHFFNDGALTEEKNTARLRYWMDEMRLSYLAELARWGTHFNRTNRTPAQWEAYHQYFFDTEFPELTGFRVELMRNAGMYPDVIAPNLSQHGGSIAPGNGITMATNAENIYYTLDGSDPRLPGGAINPLALSASFLETPPVEQDLIGSGSVWNYLDDGSDQGRAWQETNFDDSTWPSGPSELGYGEFDEATEVGFIDTDPGTSGTQRNATTYFRHTLEIPSPGSFSSFKLSLKYDDAAAVYLNGVEIIRTEHLRVDAAYDTFASRPTPDETAYFDFQLPTTAFQPGTNVLAVEIHNVSSGNNDISFDLRLRGELDPTQGNNVTDPITLDEATVFQARAYLPETNSWSALTSTFFSINTIPASPENLIVSEIHYHPANPSSTLEFEASSNPDDFEFIELLNLTNQALDLSGVRFIDGIDYFFEPDFILAPSSRLILVSDLAAFQARYGDQISVAGQYSGQLRNSGESLALEFGPLGSLLTFTYGDTAPWPTAADGLGPSLVLRSPLSNPDLSDPDSWRSHTLIGGGPTISDEPTGPGFDEWKNLNGVSNEMSDDDRDGLPALLEYALGTSPSSPDPQILPGQIEIDGEIFLTLEFEKAPGTVDVALTVETSTDLVTWVDANPTQVSPGVVRLSEPIPTKARQFLRLKATILN